MTMADHSAEKAEKEKEKTLSPTPEKMVDDMLLDLMTFGSGSINFGKFNEAQLTELMAVALSRIPQPGPGWVLRPRHPNVEGRCQFGWIDPETLAREREADEKKKPID